MSTRVMCAAFMTAYRRPTLLSTNYSKACYEFSASFRKIVWNETDRSLKRRHAAFWWQAKLLRELVEVFGSVMSQCAVNVFYHGINTDLTFQSTSFKICGPLSTTSGSCSLSLFLSVSTVSDRSLSVHILCVPQSSLWLTAHSQKQRASSSISSMTILEVSICSKPFCGRITTKRESICSLADFNIFSF